MEVSTEWEEMKKLMDLNIEVTVEKDILELKKLITKKRYIQSVVIWSKFVSGNANKKHSSDSSQDVGRKRLLLSLLSMHLLKVHLSCYHHLIHRPSSHRKHLQTMKMQNQHQNRMILERR